MDRSEQERGVGRDHVAPFGALRVAAPVHEQSFT
jgi:hypothetical protein